MAFNYQVTAQQPTAVTHVLTGNFTRPEDNNVVICKVTHIEIHLLTPEGLVPVLDAPIYGRVTVLEKFRPQGGVQDMLFVFTERYKFCVLRYDAETNALVTAANGDARDRIGHPADTGQIGVVDDRCRLIGLRLYDGLFKVIPFDDDGALAQAFNVRLEELDVLDMVFLRDQDLPVMAVLHQDTKEMRHVKTYTIDLEAKELRPGPWAQPNVENGATFLIPVARGGMLIVGEMSVTYHDGSEYRVINMLQPAAMKCYGQVDEDGSRFLLCDHLGNLSMLILTLSGRMQKVTGMKLEMLGTTSVASCVAYLDSGVVFVGSTFGDSQLVKLTADRNPENDSFLTVLDAYTNLGPIVDFAVVNKDGLGQGQIVTCSGAYKDGSLRIVRSGVGINELSVVEMAGIKGVWSLRRTSADTYHTYIAVAFVTELRFLGLDDEGEMGEADIGGFDSQGLTLYCGNGVGDTYVQVTERQVRLVSAHGDQACVSTWDAPEGALITSVAANETQVLVATGKGSLVYLEIDGGAQTLTQQGAADMGAEVACLDLTPLAAGERTTFAAVGLWDLTVRVVSVPSLAEAASVALGGEIIPRSLLFADFEGSPYLLCGLGDGTFLSYAFNVESAGMSLTKKLSLGTKPIMLRPFTTDGVGHVFAASDLPTVVTSSNRKLFFSSVNIHEATSVCAFHTEDFPECLVIVSDAGFTLGSIDEIQKLHKQTVPLGEMPRRLAHLASVACFGVLTVRFSATPSGEEEVNYVKLFDDETFEVLDSVALAANEVVCSAETAVFADDDQEYLVVGTAFVLSNEPEPTRGRILVYSAEGRQLAEAAALEVRGATYSLKAFNGALLAGVNSKLQLLRWTAEGDARQLRVDQTHVGHILNLHLDVRGDFIIVGDLMKSISLLAYKEVTGELEEIAQDAKSNWTTAVAMLSDDVFLGGENNYNLYTLQKNNDDVTDEARQRLDTVGEYHLGHFVNAFRPGSLVMNVDPSATPLPTMLYGTVSGAIGVLAQLPAEEFAFFSTVQDRMAAVVPGVGGLDHKFWRSFATDRRTSPAVGFIDGDLVETFLDLSPEQQAEVAAEVDVDDAAALAKRIEDLARKLHQ